MKRHSSPRKEVILLGQWTPERLDLILYESSKMNDVDHRIDFLSRHFLGTPYQEPTLIGDMNTPETFVINLKAVDCFTFLDYIESMRLSTSFDQFKENLRKVRYQKGKISFQNRNHFFTDWREFNSSRIDDVTKQVGGKYVICVKKILNRREDGSYFLPGIQPKESVIQYLPVDAIDDLIISELRTGDYVGIYSKEEGLDVSHVGIFIKKENNIFLRHASSLKKYRKIIDQDFRNYIADKPGILVFRSRKQSLTSVDEVDCI